MSKKNQTRKRDLPKWVDPNGNGYMARVTDDHGVRQYLGTFRSVRQAARVAKEAAREYGRLAS